MLHLAGLERSFAQAECLAGRSIDAASRLTLTSGLDAHTAQLRGSRPMGGLEVVLTRLRGSRPKAALKLTRLNFATHATPLALLQGHEEGAYHREPQRSPAPTEIREVLHFS